MTKKSKPTSKPTRAEFERDMAKIIPTAVVETDNHGQIIVYTGLKADANGVLWKWDGPEE